MASERLGAANWQAKVPTASRPQRSSIAANSPNWPAAKAHRTAGRSVRKTNSPPTGSQTTRSESKLELEAKTPTSSLKLANERTNKQIDRQTHTHGFPLAALGRQFSSRMGAGGPLGLPLGRNCCPTSQTSGRGISWAKVKLNSANLLLFRLLAAIGHFLANFLAATSKQASERPT